MNNSGRVVYVCFPSYQNPQVQFAGTRVGGVHDEVRGNRRLDASRVGHAGSLDLYFVQFEFGPHVHFERAARGTQKHGYQLLLLLI